MPNLEELKKLYKDEYNRYNAKAFQSRWVGMGGASDEELADWWRYIELLAAQIRTMEEVGDVLPPPSFFQPRELRKEREERTQFNR